MEVLLELELKYVRSNRVNKEYSVDTPRHLGGNLFTNECRHAIFYECCLVCSLDLVGPDRAVWITE